MSENNNVILNVENLVMHFPIYHGVIRRQVGAVHAVDGVSFNIKKGEDAWSGGRNQGAVNPPPGVLCCRSP